MRKSGPARSVSASGANRPGPSDLSPKRRDATSDSGRNHLLSSWAPFTAGCALAFVRFWNETKIFDRRLLRSIRFQIVLLLQHQEFKSCTLLRLSQGRIQPVSLGRGTISVMFDSEVSLRLCYCRRDNFTTLLWWNTGRKNGLTPRMVFSELHKIIANKVTFTGFRGSDRPNWRPLDPPLGWTTRGGDSCSSTTFGLAHYVLSAAVASNKAASDYERTNITVHPGKSFWFLLKFFLCWNGRCQVKIVNVRNLKATIFRRWTRARSPWSAIRDKWHLYDFSFK